MDQQKYLFCDFTFDNYIRLLKLVANKYSFCFYDENYRARSILLRHDV